MIIKQYQEAIVNADNRPKTYEGLNLLWESHGFRKQELIVTVEVDGSTFRYKIEPGQ